jgi:hypothetical protein
MSFFDSIPEPPRLSEPVRRPRPAWMEPDEVIPASVLGELLLIRTKQVAVAIGGICVYPNGFEFAAHVRMRSNDDNEPGWHDPFGEHGRRGRQLPAGVLRLGVNYALAAAVRPPAVTGCLVKTPNLGAWSCTTAAAAGLRGGGTARSGSTRCRRTAR